MTRSEVFDTVNKVGFDAIYSIPKGDGTMKEIREPAKLSGRRLDFPVVVTNSGRSAEISWNLAERLATTQTVCYI